MAAPLGVAVAVWLSEYARPAGLARAVESGVETIAGTPSVVLAIFGLLVFSKSFLAFLSQTSAGGAVFGRSFLTAGLIMALLAIPLIVGATREALAQVPAHVREASYALGKTKATTIRRVLLPSVRPSIASGITLGMGRIIGDTAIIVILLGASLRTRRRGRPPVLSILRGTGSTLTSYVKENSPAGEGNAPQKAYAAAFVLLVIVIALNAVVVRLSGGRDRARRTAMTLLRGAHWRDALERREPSTVQTDATGGSAMTPLTPPPARRIELGGEPTLIDPPPRGVRPRRQSPGAPASARARATATGEPRPRRWPSGCGSKSVSLAYGEKWVVRDVSLPVRQGEVLALIGASGSGKTTLLRSLNRLTEITAGASRAGRMTLDGEEIERIEVNELRRRISMVFQQPNPFPMSIFENVAYALREEHAARRDRKRRGRRGRRELEPAVIDAVRRAGLYDEVADDLDRPALRLSGGQQQRLCIARALAAGPEVLLLDEPCSALDPISTATIEQQIVELARERGDRDRHAQPAAGDARGRPRRLHAPRRARRVRHQRAGLRAPDPAAHARVHQRGLRVRPRASREHADVEDSWREIFMRAAAGGRAGVRASITGVVLVHVAWR